MLPRMGISAGSPRLTGLSQAAFCLAVMLFISAKAWPCSCIGIASIEETVSSLPLLVEAEVVSLERTDSPQYGPQVLSATLRVVRVLKGSVSSATITIEQLMCYASLYPELMKMRHIYVLPLSEPQNGRYAMAMCARSGMELINGKLYTFEQTRGSRRRLQFYMKYSDFQLRHRKLSP